MATAKRTTVTLRNSRRRQTVPILLPAVPNPLMGPGIASAHCRVHFLFPTTDLEFFHLDTITVAYRSDLTNPTLSCWCGAPGRATQKFTADHVSPFNGSALVPLTFLSDDPCWFELSSGSGDDDCRHTSETFTLPPNQRALADEASLIDGAPRANTAPRPLQPFSTTSLLTARTAAAVDSQEAREDSFSAGAKAALGVGVALICISIGAMAAFMYFRRRRRAPDAELSGNTLDHDRRSGRRGPEKKRAGASSDTSGQSDEPLCPIQPVYDGFPGSMGYEDVRSLHSTTTHSHSPTGASPTQANTGAFWTHERSIEQEELTAARLKSQLQPSAPTVVSYGPNPVTPTLTPRVTPRININPAPSPSTPSSIEQIPGHVPMMPLSSDYADYNNYSIPPPSAMPDTKPSPPRQPVVPIVVSYGPNRVTPTPIVVSPTVPPDESIVNRRFQEATASAVSHERQFSWEADSPLLGASMGPLPPYASTEDFEAMEKGAVRKLAEPQAQAELPPTKDGFYHYTSDIVEYELPGAAAPQHAPQLPFRPYQPHHQHHHLHAGTGGGAGPSSSGGVGGRGAGREIDEQKFLLDDVEISRMRAEKAKVRAAVVATAATAAAAATTTTTTPTVRVTRGDGEGEEYVLGEVVGRR
ncbi:hypothetical protein C8A00DRAFT_31972 [Chaetomidium leptoderma]|uniref:Uncharacterized protein n=1 Tax=Chaetomidium leptoderma TaxID=669021 RepID=A0AAN6VRM0_9PEZI|nr:hypothetical protein C8A00DRAFT_31972 [Chaetomidium leptoderma]